MAATLNSDHVNYLIWRYLQEHGYPHTAVQLMRDWGIDPQKLPFASSIGPYELISMLQDGLMYDELQSLAQSHITQSPSERPSVSPAPPSAAKPSDNIRYQFIRVPMSRRESSLIDGTGMTDNSVPSRSSHPPSRKRPRLQINGGTQNAGRTSLNGVDSMDIDYETSPGVNSKMVEPEAQPLVTTLSVGESTGVQCENKEHIIKAKTVLDSTMKGSDIIHLSWSDNDANSLLTTGGSIWRTWKMPAEDGSSDATNLASTESSTGAVKTEEETMVSPTQSTAASAIAATNFEDVWPQGKPFFVTATSRSTSDNRHVAIALETEDARGLAGTELLLKRGKDMQLIGAQQETVLSLRWDPTGKYILAVSVLDEVPMVTVWDVNDSSIVGDLRTSKPVLDAAWTHGMHVVLCGEGFLEYAELSREPSIVSSIDTKATWEKVRFDSLVSKVACIASQDDQLALLNIDNFSIQATAGNDGQITAMEWQPSQSYTTKDSMPRILATSSNNGAVKLWNAKSGLECIHTFTMEPAMALAFSPDGSLIAAAGESAVRVWEMGNKYALRALWNAVEAETTSSRLLPNGRNISNDQDQVRGNAAAAGLQENGDVEMGNANVNAAESSSSARINGENKQDSNAGQEQAKPTNASSEPATSNGNASGGDDENASKAEMDVDVANVDTNADGRNGENSSDANPGPYYTLAWNADASKLGYGRGETISVIALPAQNT